MCIDNQVCLIVHCVYWVYVCIVICVCMHVSNGSVYMLIVSALSGARLRISLTKAHVRWLCDKSDLIWKYKSAGSTFMF